MEASIHQQVSSRFKQGVMVNKCVVPKNIDTHPPPRKALLFKTPNPLEFSFQKVLVIPLQPLEVLYFSNSVGYPLERIFPLKNVVALYVYAKDNCICYKARKILLITSMLIQCQLISMLPCKGLSQFYYYFSALFSRLAQQFVTRLSLDH